MLDTTTKKSGRPRSAKSHHAILKATIELLAEVGFERMSIDMISTHAKVGKSTIYRRYNSKEELVTDAIESLKEEVTIPDTGNLWSDLEVFIQIAVKTIFSSLGRQIVAILVSAESSNFQVAQVYWKNYMKPQKEAFLVVLERAKARKEIQRSVDSDLVFDIINGIMLYILVFQTNTEPREIYFRRALRFLLCDTSDLLVSFNNEEKLVESHLEVT